MDFNVRPNRRSRQVTDLVASQVRNAPEPRGVRRDRGEVLERSAPLVCADGTLVTIVGPPTVRPADGRAVFFVVEPDRFRLADLAARVRSGRLNPIIGAVRPLAEVPSVFAPGRRMPGKTIIQVTEGG
jgi:hypothetical protein